MLAFFKHTYTHLTCAVKMDTAAITGGTKKKTEFCNQFWTFNCDEGEDEEDCVQLNARMCNPSKQHMDYCALSKSAGGDKYRKCRPTEQQAKDLVRDFEADDTYDNWFAGACSKGHGSTIVFKTPEGEDKEIDGCAEAKACKETSR